MQCITQRATANETKRECEENANANVNARFGAMHDRNVGDAVSIMVPAQRMCLKAQPTFFLLLRDLKLRV